MKNHPPFSIHESRVKPKVRFLLICEACFCSSALCRFHPNFIVYVNIPNSCSQLKFKRVNDTGGQFLK